MRHALAKALWHNQVSDQLCIKPSNIIDQLMMANQELGAGNAHPMDWDGKMLTLIHQGTGDVYDCTMSVEERSAD